MNLCCQLSERLRLLPTATGRETETRLGSGAAGLSRLPCARYYYYIVQAASADIQHFEVTFSRLCTALSFARASPDRPHSRRGQRCMQTNLEALAHLIVPAAMHWQARHRLKPVRLGTGRVQRHGATCFSLPPSAESGAWCANDASAAATQAATWHTAHTCSWRST